ncbi:hypothetical protein TNCV_1812761 [Trichonephila clavipes]|uniref:Uncharacterized protein n=1 Tax=Trichonephila clavipes TaxID=2585209 RepID=A0A8X6W8R3_TRICX|nr:hypothetical protein TNCV_1812761 [Trichonephila clavipes]
MKKTSKKTCRMRIGIILLKCKLSGRERENSTPERSFLDVPLCCTFSLITRSSVRSSLVSENNSTRVRETPSPMHPKPLKSARWAATSVSPGHCAPVTRQIVDEVSLLSVSVDRIISMSSPGLVTPSSPFERTRFIHSC